MLLAGMELKVIADQLGHSSVMLTADTYLNSRELHQAGEKRQAAMSERGSSGLSGVFIMAA
jgi:integrase